MGEKSDALKAVYQLEITQSYTEPPIWRRFQIDPTITLQRLHDFLAIVMGEGPSSAQLPVVIAGERACPPEDVGGVGGYEQLLWALKNPEDPEAADRLEWGGDQEFDPEAFDIDAVNRILKAEAKSKKTRR